MTKYTVEKCGPPSSVVTVSRWSSSVGFGSVSRKKLQFRFGTVRFARGRKGKLRHSPIFNIIQRNHHKKILKDQI